MSLAFALIIDVSTVMRVNLSTPPETIATSQIFFGAYESKLWIGGKSRSSTDALAATTIC